MNKYANSELINPAHNHYGRVTNVACDRCHKLIPLCIGIKHMIYVSLVLEIVTNRLFD